MSDRPRVDSSSDRRRPTVLFADISGFTAMSERMDPEDVADAMNGCFQLVERIILERGGTIDKYIGDAVMALFGAPQALEHAARQALNAAIEIRNAIEEYGRQRNLPAKLGVHIGVNTGLVLAGDMGGDVRRDYTVMGKTVNLAARLEGAAEVGQIFVGAETYHATRREFEFRRLEGLKLKGIPEVEAYELLSGDEQLYRSRPGTERHGLSAPLIGRETELEAVARRLRELADGRGGVVSIVGENGIGKSRLLAEVEQLEAAQGLAFYEGRSLQTGRGLVFHPFVDLIRSLAAVTGDDVLPALRSLVERCCPDEADETTALLARMMELHPGREGSRHIADLSGDALERAIRRALARLVEGVARERPLVVVMEDLHWADLSSATLLESLLALMEGKPVLFVLVARTDYETTDRFLRFLREHPELRHTHLRLQPLSPASSGHLIESLLGSSDLPPAIREQVEQRAEGNPFYIEEVLRALLDQRMISIEKDRLRVLQPLVDFEIPATIEEVILSRVDQLDSDVARVLQVASVIGRRFQRRLLEQMLPAKIDLDGALAELAARQLVLPITTRAAIRRRVVPLRAESDFTFKHALIQEAVYGSLLRKTRRELHAACAAAIEQIHADRLPESFAMLAHHYACAEDLEKAEEYTFRAGEEAAKAAASKDALLHFREAYRLYLRLHAHDADHEKLAVLEKNIAQALFNIGNLGESIEHFDAALELWGVWVPRSPLSRWLKLAWDMGSVLARIYLAGNHYGRSTREKDRHIVEAMYNRARAENITDTTRAFFDTIGTPRYLRRLDPRECEYASEITSTSGAFFAFAGLSPAIGRRFLEEGRRLIRPDRPSDAFSHQAMRMVVEFHAGDWSDAFEIDDELLERGIRSGRLWGADVYLGMLAERNIRQGRFAEVDRQIEILERLCTEHGYEFASSNVHDLKAFRLLEQRRLAEAQVAMQAYYDVRQEDNLHVFSLSGLAKIALMDGRREDAEQALARAEKIVESAPRLPPFYLAPLRTSQLLLAATRLEHRPGHRNRRAALRAARRAVAITRSIARERVEALRVSGRVHRLCGRKARALAAWRAALAEGERLRAGPELGRTCLEIATALADSWPGETFLDLGASGWLSRGRELFERFELPFDWSEAHAIAVKHGLEWPEATAAAEDRHVG